MKPTQTGTVQGGPVPDILVIDDDPSIRALVQDVLEIEGFAVRLAEDGFAGLRALEARRPA